jgi:hypothetical protein
VNLSTTRNAPKRLLTPSTRSSAVIPT